MKTKLLALTSSLAFLISAVAEWGLDVDLPLTPALWLVMAAVVFCATSAPAALTTNTWQVTDGKWELGINWDHGVPVLSDSINIIKNTGGMFASRATTIDAATVLSKATTVVW